MAKYDPLRRHMTRLSGIEWTASFSEIEDILGGTLPASATQHRTWWANSGGLLVHQQAWLMAGWRVEAVEIGRRQVTFRRKGVGGAKTARPENGRRAAAVAGVAAPLRAPGLPNALRKALEASRKPVNLSARVDWTDIGTAEREAEGWRFPIATGVPALCRIHIFIADEHRVLVMAVRDLNAFLRHLEADAARVPGPRGDAVEDHLATETRTLIAEADHVSVDAAIPGQAWILVDGRGRKADLADLDESWFVARAAAVVGRQSGLESVLLTH